MNILNFKFYILKNKDVFKFIIITKVIIFIEFYHELFLKQSNFYFFQEKNKKEKHFLVIFYNLNQLF